MQPLRNTRPIPALVAALLAAVASGAALAGPPFLTDDPEPVEYKHAEAYVFATLDRTPDDKTVQAPAFELNFGIHPDVQIHFVAPFTHYVPDGGPRASGLGDAEVGVKYRFVHETGDRPQIGVFPMAELASGDSDRGLGNGRTWWKLPLWIQKRWGPWTTYGGGGVALNDAPGMRDYGFGGWLVQRAIGDALVLGGEVFAQGKTSDGGRSATLANFGGTYTPGAGCGGCELLFSAGREIAGEHHTIAYLGLYWEFGAKDGVSETRDAAGTP